MRTERRRLVWLNTPPVPVEYIHADKRQMIQTDWVPGLDPKIELDMRLDNLVQETGLYNTIFGVIEADRNVSFAANFGGGINQGTQIYFWNDKLYNSGGVIKSVSPIYYTQRALLTMTSDSATAYARYEWSASPQYFFIKLNSRTAANTEPITLLGTAATPMNRYDTWLYGVKCWNDGVLEREYVPAKKSGVYGLLDKVEGKFLASMTGVDFLGPE